MISDQADKDANIIWGAAFDESMDDAMRVTVIATGFATRESYIPIPPSSNSSSKPQFGASGSRWQSPSNNVFSDSSYGKGSDVVEDIMSIFNK